MLHVIYTASSIYCTYYNILIMIICVLLVVCRLSPPLLLEIMYFKLIAICVTNS